MIDYNVPRQHAANIVWVSLRSIDRYALAWKLAYKKVSWRVLFNSQDLLNLKLQKNTEVLEDINTNFNFRKERIESRATPVFNTNQGNAGGQNHDQGQNYDHSHNKSHVQTFSQDNNQVSSPFDLVEYVKAKTERDMYRTMYSSLQEELKWKQSELEKMHYKIWELASKQEVPLLENQKNKEQLISLKKEIIDLNEELSYQRVIKWVFVWLLFVTVAILSLWYFYTFKT